MCVVTGELSVMPQTVVIQTVGQVMQKNLTLLAIHYSNVLRHNTTDPSCPVISYH